MLIRPQQYKRAFIAAAGFLFTLPLIATPSFADTYTYDARGRLYTATLSNGTVTYYCYDAAGNRTYVGPVANC